MIFAAPFMAAALMLAPFQPGYVPIAISTFVFFAAYHFYTSPYQSLIADVTPANSAGKVQGYQAFMRGGGMFLGMVVAGVLFYRWEPLAVHPVRPPHHGLHLPHGRQGSASPSRRRSSGRERQGIVGRDQAHLALHEENKPHPAVHGRHLPVGVDPGRPAALHHAVLHLHPRSHRPRSARCSSGLVGVTYMVAALASGYLADKYGRFRLMRVGLVVFLGGCMLGFFMRDIKWAFIFLPIFGLGGSIVLTLPYAILMSLMPKEHIGQFTGMFSMMRGLANIVAPVLAGRRHRHRRPTTCPGAPSTPSSGCTPRLMIVISLFFFRNTGRDERHLNASLNSLNALQVWTGRAGHTRTNLSGCHVACAAGKEADVRPGPDVRQQSQTRDRRGGTPGDRCVRERQRSSR